MKIILILTNAKRKSSVFVTETLQTLSLSEMIDAVVNRVIEKMYMVTGTSGTYIRSAPDGKTKNNIDTLSITGPQLMAIAQGHAHSTPTISRYFELYLKSLPEEVSYIKPVESFHIPLAIVKRVFQSHATIIKEAAQEFDIDKYLLGAIIIDEIARLVPFEPLIEKIGADIVGRNISIGVAQMTLETAHDLIKAGVYTPNPHDKKLPFKGALTNIDRMYLYNYVIDPIHNIRFAAAFIQHTTTIWLNKIDLSHKPEIIGTLYSIGYGVPKINPTASKRGYQISSEFYALAKQWLIYTDNDI